MSYFGDVWDWLSNGDNWSGDRGVPTRIAEHVQMSVVSLVVATLIALPIGLLLGHFRRGAFFAISVSNIGRAIPALAVLLIAVLAWGIGDPPAFLTSIGVVSLPAFVALVLLAIPPILTNAYVGVAEVDRNVREAATGMGMNGGEVLRRVELPLAGPLIMAGIRSSAVAVIATATLMAYVNGGGLGRFIIDGSRISYDDPRVFVGALFVALLSVGAELLFALVERLIIPRPLRASSMRAGNATRVAA